MIKKIFLLPIKFYQYVISPLTNPCCRFLPTCSCYARAAIEKHGTLRGLYLFFIRFAKCHPWGPHGYDPVPDDFHWNPWKKTGKTHAKQSADSTRIKNRIKTGQIRKRKRFSR